MAIRSVAEQSFMCKRPPAICRSKLQLSVLVAVLAIIAPHASSAAILFADDFETPGWNGTSTGWTNIVNDPGTNGATLQSTTTNPYPSSRGTHSLQAYFAQGTKELGLYKTNLNWNEIYVRWYIYYDTGFLWPVSPNINKKEFRVFGSTASEDLVFNSRTWGTSAHWAFHSEPYYKSAGQAWLYMNVGPEIRIQRGTWYCLELHILKGQGTGAFEGWVNDVQKWQYLNIDTGSEPIQSMELLVTFSGASPINQYQWVDDFVVSDQKIGCGKTP